MNAISTSYGCENSALLCAPTGYRLRLLAQPSFFLLAFGFRFGPVFEKGWATEVYLQFHGSRHHRGECGPQFLSYSGVAILWNGQFGFLEGNLWLRGSPPLIMIGRTLVEANRGHDQEY